MGGKEGRKPNRLIHEKSPYLLQHAYNPVDWHPWGEEAFAIAKAEDKPIFLSIGYSTCHWCHVMERESFEDEEVAAFLNRHFVPVKVDREERPDIDHIYMTVCQEMTGQGGWPLTVIMTPEKEPFFAGTYFPKKRRFGRPGLMEILAHIHERWAQDKEAVRKTAKRVTEAIRERATAKNEQAEALGGETVLSRETLHKAYAQYVDTFDPEYGGFGEAPKFPTPHHLLFLLRYWKTTGDPHALAMVEKTLQCMHAGGIYDHLGFGFARYSTDRRWLVPHFEKMLYDNALLAYTYLEAYQATKDGRYAQVAEEIFTYVLRDMTSPEGAFYSAEDADSEGVEGKFYVWTPGEIKGVLGEEDGAWFCRIYGVTEHGNFAGKNILNLIDSPLERFAQDENLEIEALHNKLASLRKKLFAAREKRVHPHKDDKILTAWNGLMIAALAKGAQVLGQERYLEAGEKALAFIFAKLRRSDGRLLARYRDGEARYPGFLDDYAFLIWALLELYEASFDPQYLEDALRLHRDMIKLFWDNKEGGLFFYGEDSERLIMRPKELYDGAIPSGNSVAALNLLRLAKITADEEITRLAERQLQTFAAKAERYPSAYAYFLMAHWFALGPSKEIVLAGDPADREFRELLAAVRSYYLPEAVTLVHPEGKEGERVETIAPFIKGQRAVGGRPTAYVCENYACHAPVTDEEELRSLLANAGG
ncbi:thioredoxin domain-containing protein [Bacillaceae bacterium]